MAFDPHPYLIKLPRKVKDKASGTWSTVYDDYLEVKWRLCWFRDRYPHGVITTEEVCVDLERGYARFRATVEDGEGGKATGYGTETKAGFEDYCERAETRALGRALAALGIGTQFVGQELSELPHVVDAPVASSNGQPEADVPDVPPPTTNGDTPLPTTVPEGWACGGQAISALKPAQLRMLLSRADQLAAAEGSAWRPLLEALAAERQARLQTGSRPTPLSVAGEAQP